MYNFSFSFIMLLGIETNATSKLQKILVTHLKHNKIPTILQDNVVKKTMRNMFTKRKPREATKALHKLADDQ